MKLPLSWLKDYVTITLPVKELGHRLTMAGIEVGGITTVGGSWEHVSVGHVLGVEPHPNADRLRLATVDLGDGRQMRVVCGAPNLAVGQKVAFAQVGARLFDTHTSSLRTLEAARIRGVRSEGMVCSEKELGLGEDHTGILVLPSDAPVGTPLADYMGDSILDLEVTPNRPDCLSMLGVAWEVGAIEGQQVRSPKLDYAEHGAAITGQVAVEIADPGLCPRYCASLVRGVKIGPSPRWMQDRLLKAGMRPINNVVDITNYVMLEYGQPLHAFDFALVRDKKIVVRRARAGEVLTTLDGMERQLSADMLLITDGGGPVAIAGVMGGGNSEVSETTTDVLLESANFNNIGIRRTSARLKLRTEASIRFDKGLNPDLPMPALRRATQLLVELADGKVALGIADAYPGRKQREPLRLTRERVRKVLGQDFSPQEMMRVLGSLGFQCRPDENAAVAVEIPFWRSDISIEDDLAEELARVVGYDHMPTTMLATSLPAFQPEPMLELKQRIRQLLVVGGMQEIITYSLTSLSSLEKIEAASSMPLKVANPMSPEQEYLRTSLRANLLATLAANKRHEDGPIGIFELGRVYLPRERELPLEKEMLVGVLSGPRAELSRFGESGKMDFFDAKGVMETLLSALGLAVSFEKGQDPLLHPGRTARLVASGETLGWIGEVHPRILGRFDVTSSPVAFFEVEVEKLLALVQQEGKHFAPLSRYPAVVRDLALVLDEGVAARQVEEVLKGSPLVRRVVLFDVYIGEKVPPGKKSLAYRLLFQSGECTLTGEVVQLLLDNLLGQLKEKTGATLRT